MNSPRLCLAVPAAATAVCLVGLLLAAYGGWYAQTGVEGGGFCEPLTAGRWVLQPANTWSNLGFVVAGWLIGWQAQRDLRTKKAGSWHNPFVDKPGYAAGYALTAVLIGAGSGAMHASMTRWGGDLDRLSMHLWAGWVIAYATKRLVRGGDGWFLAVLTVVVSLIALRLALGNPFGWSGSYVFERMILIGAVLEIAARLSNRKRTADTVYLILGVAAFAIGFACWKSALIGRHPDQPHQWCYGHAAWHLCCAVSVWLIYLYARSERDVTPAATPG